ncbi:hypothetical protein GGTG_06212 [Gaeumannomyces tritici R3-111a-1]|uniref:Uncharacterized protein n=1 Tax=Gaeumannomyces tritici (strain R3-111a-1) TaxID=644352 RepID=J3NY58_GAET3|nr:hypothetical protein GGTG_06212 [Gaeumannomyces tritici R3-111a-1]EJT76291.1 hypothetical protein GGTG_06212 [Gaeumannomyces tritici R3-111a-1]
MPFGGLGVDGEAGGHFPQPQTPRRGEEALFQKATWGLVYRGARSSDAVFPGDPRRPVRPEAMGESLILMPHRAIATAMSDAMGHFWEALFLMADVEKAERRGSNYRFWSFSPHASAQTRCQATVVAQNESFSVNGSRLVVFPDVRSKDAEMLYQNMTIPDAGLDRFLSIGHSSVPRLFFFNLSTPGLWRNVSIVTAISLPLEGQGSVLYGCVSTTKWIWADLKTTPNKTMTTRLATNLDEMMTTGSDTAIDKMTAARPGPLPLGWEVGNFHRVLIEKQYADLIDVPIGPSTDTTIFQRLATAAGLAGPGGAASRSAVTTLGHVETLVNMLLAMGLSNSASDADTKPRLTNPDGKWCWTCSGSGPSSESSS